MICICSGQCTSFWNCKLQHVVALLSAEVEHFTARAATKEALWIRVVLRQKEFIFKGPTKSYCNRPSLHSYDKESKIPCKNKTYQKEISLYLGHCKSPWNWVYPLGDKSKSSSLVYKKSFKNQIWVLQGESGSIFNHSTKAWVGRKVLLRRITYSMWELL